MLDEPADGRVSLLDEMFHQVTHVLRQLAGAPHHFILSIPRARPAVDHEAMLPNRMGIYALAVRLSL